MKLIKSVKRYGNSGGVYLPSSWIGGQVEVRLVSRPPAPERDIPEALGPMMKHVIAAFAFGSYARKENTKNSDIDIILVADKHLEEKEARSAMRPRNYDVQVFMKEQIENAARKDPLFRKSLEEAVPIINADMLERLKALRPEAGSLRERIDFAESSLRIVKQIVHAGGDPSDLIYPLVMRVKEMLMIRCVHEDKPYSIGLLEQSLRSKGISRSEYSRIIRAYRSKRDNIKGKRFKLGQGTISRLVGLLEELIADARKEEKAKERHAIN